MNLNRSGSNYSILIYNFTLGPIDTNNPFATTTQLGIYFSNALISYSNEDTKQRRHPIGDFPRQIPVNYSIIKNLNNTYDINCNVSDILSNLLPDVEYSFNVRVNNTLNNNYSPPSSNSSKIKTLLPPYPPRLSVVSLCNADMYYTRKGLSIASRNDILDILCNSLIIQRGGLCNVINNGGPITILTDKTPGWQVGGDAANITVICGTIDSNRFQLNGWQDPLVAGSLNQTSPSGNSIIKVGSQQQDPHVGNQRLSNFYLQASNVSVIITPTFLRASHEPYSYSITHSNRGYSNRIIPFSNIYVDNLTQIASIVSLSNNDGTYGGRFISGLFCLSNDQTYNFNLDLLNFASNFLPACNILVSATLSYTSLNDVLYSSVPISLTSNTILYNISDNEIGSGPVPTQVRLKLTNITLSGNNDIFFINDNDSQITASLTIENLVGTASVSRPIPYYFDTLSLSNLSINHSNSKAIGGEQFISFSNLYCNVFISYDHREQIYNNLTCNIYNNELPLVEGHYRTGGNIGIRFDSLGSFVLPSNGSIYPTAYTNIKNETQVRYATFKYSLSNSSNNKPVKALEFNMNSAGMFSYIDAINCNFNLNQVPTLLYKVYNVNNDPNNPINTGWLNGNGSLSSETPLNVNIARDGSNGLLPNSTNFPIVNIRRYWNIIEIPPNTSYDVYIKIGLQSACNLYFDYMYLQSKYLDLATFNTPSNGVFQVISPPRDVKISWSNIGTDGYEIHNTRITGNYSNDSIYPRRFVGIGRYIDNPIDIRVYGGITQCNITLSNADTKYTINLANTATNGTISSNHIINGKTDLPVYPRSNFYNGSMKFKFFKADNTEGVYFTNCNAFLIDGVNRIRASNIINRQELSIHLVTTVGDNNDPFIINSSNSTLPEYYPGSGLSNFILYANINGSIASNQFSNEQYSNNTTIFDRSNNNIKLQFLNAGDISTDVRDKGFFYKSALQVITLATLRDGSNTITLSNNYMCNYSQSFFANSSLTPAVNKVFVDTNGLADPAYYTYVSGVLVFRTITACNYNFWMQTSNLNSKFIMDTPITFALQSNSVNIFNLPVNGLNVIVYSNSTGVILSNSFVNANNNTFFSWPNVSLSNQTNIGPTNTLSLVGRAFNLSGGSTQLSELLRTESEGLLYFDNASFQTIQLTSSSNFANNQANLLCNWGYRVTSGTGLNPAVNTFGELYNHRSNILSDSIYSNELQLANGYFTNSNSVAYINYNIYYNPISSTYTYPDYTSITTSGGIRWATFMWNINIASFYGTIQFNDHNLISSQTNVNPVFWTFTHIQFYYKIVSRTNPLKTDSAWLNGNLFYTSANNPNTAHMTTFNSRGGISTNRVTGATPNSNTRYILTRDASINVGAVPYLLYIRIGLSNSSGPNQYFRNIRLKGIGTL
jgi:hypothetical protein